MTFQSTQAVPFFPTMVWAHDLAPTDHEPLNQAILAKLDELLSPRPAIQANQTWQTDQSLHKLPEFQPLVGFIQEAAQSVIEAMEIESPGFEITGCWANINPKGSPHSPHTHPNNYLSGVYYVKTAPGSDSISFYDPRPMANVIAPKRKKPNNFNMRKLEMRVPTGRLVIFPAWLQHGVERNMSDDERITVSFNIMFSAFTETVSPPKWEGIAI